MSEESDRNDVDNDDGNESNLIDRRGFIKGAGAVVAGAAAVGLSSIASADSFQETADRYIPPGQWWHHTGTEWYEFPSDDPKVIEVFGYTDKLSYLPGEEVALHITTGAPRFDIEIYRDGGELELVHEVKGVAGMETGVRTQFFLIQLFD